MDEHLAHWPEPWAWLRKLVDGREKAGGHDDGCSEPADYPNGQNPGCRSQQQHDESRKGYRQRNKANAEGPHGAAPVLVVLQFRRSVHSRDCAGWGGCWRPGWLVLNRSHSVSESVSGWYRPEPGPRCRITSYTPTRVASRGRGVQRDENSLGGGV